MREQVRSVVARWRGRPAAAAHRGDLDGAARHSGFRVRRVHDHARRVSRLLRLEAHDRRGLVDVHRDRTRRAVRLALRPHGVVPRRAGHSLNSVAVDAHAGRWITLGPAPVHAAVHSSEAGWPGACGGVDSDRMVHPCARVGVVRGAHRHTHWLVVDLECLAVRRRDPGGICGADAERQCAGTWDVVACIDGSAVARGPCRVGTLLPFGRVGHCRGPRHLAIAHVCRHAADAGRVRGGKRERPRITGRIPDPLFAPILEPKVVGPLCAEERSLRLGGGELDRAEDRSPGARAARGVAVHLPAPVGAGERGIGGGRQPVSPRGAATSVIRAARPPRPEVADGPND